MYDEFQIIANNVKALRMKKGYTQEKLAEAAGVSASHLSKVETGQKRMGMQTYLKVLHVLCVTEEEYVSLTVKKEDDEMWEKFRRIMGDCTESEKEFLLRTLEQMKDNLKLLQERKIRQIRTKIQNICGKTSN